VRGIIDSVGYHLITIPALLVACCAFVPAANGAPAGQWEGKLGISALDFGYKEFDDRGALLDREDGAVPGIVAGLTRELDSTAIGGDLSYHSGDVAYDGQTNLGAPHKTRTDEKFVDARLHVGHWLPTQNGLRSKLYGGIGYHRWKRDIRATSTVSGISETYDWWYGFLGINGSWRASPRSSFGADLKLTHTIDPKITVDFADSFVGQASNGSGTGLDDVRLDLGGKFGFILSLAWRYDLSRGRGLLVEPYYERWDLGRSETVPLTQGGIVVGRVFEPKSETRNLGLNLSLVQSF
jgi:hypothetical protein